MAQTSKDFGFLPIPKGLRYVEEKSAHFGLALNVSFGLAGMVIGMISFESGSRLQRLTRNIVTNLYYCQPILSEIY
jgi:hypothetical protein